MEFFAFGNWMAIRRLVQRTGKMKVEYLKHHKPTMPHDFYLSPLRRRHPVPSMTGESRASFPGDTETTRRWQSRHAAMAEGYDERSCDHGWRERLLPANSRLGRKRVRYGHVAGTGSGARGQTRRQSGWPRTRSLAERRCDRPDTGFLCGAVALLPGTIHPPYFSQSAYHFTIRNLLLRFKDYRSMEM
jgi:hypothetical protein